jgi:hypothetical protein
MDTHTHAMMVDLQIAQVWERTHIVLTEISSQSEIPHQMAMFVEGLLSGSKILETISVPITYVRPCNVSPTVGKEHVLPVLGDADTTCKVFILQIGGNESCDLRYLESVQG